MPVPFCHLSLSATESLRGAIEVRFDQLCQSKTGYPDLNAALGLLHAKRSEFLAVLEYPQLPLHNNLSENDIREYTRLRKISGGTVSVHCPALLCSGRGLIWRVGFDSGG